MGVLNHVHVMHQFVIDLIEERAEIVVAFILLEVVLKGGQFFLEGFSLFLEGEF